MIKLKFASSLTGAVITNFAAQAWGVFISIIFVPFYLRYLGAEGYGVVGFSTTLLAIVAYLDGGLTLTVNRQMAQLSGDRTNADRMREILSAGTALFLILALCITIAVGLAASWIANNWLNATTISPNEIALSIRLIGLVLGEQIVTALFQGALSGLHRQELMNMLSIATSTLRAVGAILVLKYIHPTPSVFFAWYAAVMMLQIILMRIAIGTAIGRGTGFRLPRRETIRALLHSTAGMGAVAILTLLLSQIDKLIVSRLLTLQDFGYYMIAVSISLATLLVAGPVTNAFFPRLTRLAHSDALGAIAMLHTMNQTVMVIAAPVGWLFAFFSYEIIFLWTGNAALTAHVAPLTAILGVAYALNALLQSTYYFEMAFARTRSIIALNTIAVFIMLPSIILFGRLYGGPGVAACWLALNLFNFLIGAPLILRKSLGPALRAFYIRDIIPCCIAAGAVVGLARVFTPPGLPRFAGGAILLVTGATAFAACCLSAPHVRAQIVLLGRRLLASSRGANV
jgi:O-antigen/teichoic acid export membrane protein